MSQHATVIIGAYTVPLIGIPISATEMECGCCHQVVHISQVNLNLDGTQFLCGKCRTEWHDVDEKTGIKPLYATL